MSEHRTLRWGSNETLTLNPGDGARHPVPRQLLQLYWDVPLSWVVLLAMNPQFDTSETANFTVTWTFTVGVGQATGTSVFSFNFAAVAGVYAPQSNQIFIPGENVQLSASLTGTPTATKQESFNLACWGAPNNADVLGEMNRWEEQNGRIRDASDRDMIMGGPHELPLRYMPR